MPNLADIFSILQSCGNCSRLFISQAGGRSVLLTATRQFFVAMPEKIAKSSGVSGLLPSKITIAKSAEARFSQTRSMPAFSIMSCGWRIPAVSTRLTGMPRISIRPVITSRVVPGISVTIALFFPVRVLSRLDLPTLGLPAITTLSPSV